MKRFFLISKLMVACFLIVGAHGFAFAQKLPVIDGKETVATVNDEPITVDELNRAIASSHVERTGMSKAGRIDFSPILERMINTRLLLLEARNMGFDELPEIISAVDDYSKQTLMEILLEQHVKDIKADENEVEQLYSKEVKEWKIKAIKFKKETDAKTFETQVKAKNNFDTIAKKAVAEGIAQGGEEEYLKDKDLTSQASEIVLKMEVGSISPVISAGDKGYIIFKLEGFRFPENEDPQTREKARLQALNQKRVSAAKNYYKDLRKKYVKIDQKFLDALDFESKTSGFEKLLNDDRIVAEVMGEKPVTVGELAKALKNKFFHGIEKAIEGKKINKRKAEILEGIVERRVLQKEALIQGIDKTETYSARVKEYKNSVIFGAVINKAVAPEIKLKTEELKTYYKENSKDYTSPEMMKIKSLVFAKRNDAVEALDKLTKGTDFNWMSSHADDQVDKAEKGLLKFEGKLFVLNSLPEGVQKSVSNVKPGDFRLYESPEGHFYILYIYHVVEPKLQSFEDVKKKIAKKVYQNKINKAVEDWADKLKEYYPVKIYIKDLRK
ncbi:MAG: peptidyl-prolyl cis-trans isomerase [Desulfobacterales bacterium]|nr:peptidyl-prolyl cis-trans isomerase [Desulfobacterales bacterium]